MSRVPGALSRGDARFSRFPGSDPSPRGDERSFAAVAGAGGGEVVIGPMPLAGGRYRVEVLADSGAAAAHDLAVPSGELDGADGVAAAAGALVADDDRRFVLVLK